MKNNIAKRLALLLSLSVVAFLIYYFFLKNHITLENLKTHRASIQVWVEQHYLLSVFLYIVALVATAFFNIPITVLQTIAGGFLFGPLVGALYANSAVVLGSLFSFLLFRYVLGHLVQKKYEKELVAFNRNIEKYGANYMLVLHFLPFTPTVFDSVAGLTKLPTWTFVWTTFVGMMPGTLIYTFAGQRLATIENIRDLVTWPLIVLFLLLAIVSALPVIFNRYSLNQK